MYKNNFFELNEYFSIEDIEDENKVEILLIELDDISNKTGIFEVKIAKNKINNLLKEEYR